MSLLILGADREEVWATQLSLPLSLHLLGLHPFSATFWSRSWRDLFSLSGLEFPHLQNAGNNNTNMQGDGEDSITHAT